MGRLVLSQNERLLLHLLELEKHRDAPQVPLAASQEGIARRLATQVHNASRALSALESEGLVEGRLAHVRGAPKRRRAYFLTDKGRTTALRTRNDLLSRDVVFEEHGKALRVPLEDAVVRLSSLGISLGLLDILDMARDNGVLKSEDIRAKHADLETPRRIIQLAIGRPRLSRFVGRENERQELLAGIGNEAVHSILIWGIPGIGKTSLGSRVFEELSGRAPLFWYSIHSWDSAEHFLRMLAEFLRAAGQSSLADELKRGLNPGDMFSPLLKDLADSGAVLFLDDIHNASDELNVTLTVLADAADASGRSKIVLMSRSVPPFFSKTATSSKYMELKGLDPSSARKLVENSRAEDLARAVRESHGHPLFLTLMARSGIPESTGDVVSFVDREIVSNLTEDERAILDLLSIYRHPVPPEALVEDSDHPLITLKEKGLVVEQELGVASHDLLGEFFFSRMSPDARTRLHRRAAAYCESRPGSDWTLEALYHWVEARDWENAARISRDSWETLAEDFPDETLRLVSSICLDGFDSRGQSEIQFIIGQLFERVGDDSSAAEWYEDCLSLLGNAEESELRAAVFESLGSLKTRVQEWAKSLEAHEDALRLYEKSDDRTGQIREWMNIGGVHRKKGDYSRTREAYTKALSIASMEEDRGAQAACLNNIALLDWDEGRLRDAEMRLKESVGLAHAVKDHFGEAKGLENLAALFRAQSRMAEATSIFQESSEAYRRAEDLAEFKRLQAAVAVSMADQGLLDDGIELCKSLIADPELRKRRGLFHRTSSFDFGDVALYFSLVDMLRATGDCDSASDEIRKLMSIAESLDDEPLLAKAKVEFALTEETSGNLDGAVRMLKEAEEILIRVGDKEGLIAIHMLRGGIEEERGNRDTAVVHYREAARHAELSRNAEALLVARENLKSLGIVNP